jgi:hypothetical protein
MTAKLLRTLALAAALSLPSIAQSAGFRFPVGLAYGGGIYDAYDEIFDMYEDAGWDVDDRVIIPLGLTFNPYYEFDNGIGVGMGLGPTAFVFVSEDTYDYYNGHDEETRFSFAIPIGLDVRYTFLRQKQFSPYIRAGFRYPIAGGDNIEDSRIGAFGAVGVEFLRTKSVGFGFEVGYDSSEITVNGPDAGQRKDITFTGFTATLSVIF